MKITDAAAQIEKAVETAATALPPDPDMIRKNDLENLIRKMDFGWGNGAWVMPLGHRKVEVQEDGEGLFIEVKGKQFRGRNLILYIIGGNRYDSVALVQIAFAVLDGKSDPERFCKINGYEATEKNPAHRMMMLVQNALSHPTAETEVKSGTESVAENQRPPAKVASTDLPVDNISLMEKSGSQAVQSKSQLSGGDAEREASVMAALENPSTDVARLVNHTDQTELELLLCQIQVGLILVEKKTSMESAAYKEWKRTALPAWSIQKRDDALRCGMYITRVKHLRGGRLYARDVLKVDKKAIWKLGGPNEEASDKLLGQVLQMLDEGQRVTIKHVKVATGSPKKKDQLGPVPNNFTEFYGLVDKISDARAKTRFQDLLVLIKTIDLECSDTKPDKRTVLEAAFRLL